MLNTGTKLVDEWSLLNVIYIYIILVPSQQLGKIISRQNETREMEFIP